MSLLLGMSLFLTTLTGVIYLHKSLFEKFDKWTMETRGHRAFEYDSYESFNHYLGLYKESKSQ